MKNIFLVIILFAGICQLNAQDVMTIDGESVSLDEFVHTLMKNNDDKKITKEYLDDYLDLFINYKLKVMEAKRLGIDKEQSFISELEVYRKQLAKPYLQAKEFNEDLIYEAYDRMKYDVHASHILFKLDEKSPNDTLDKYKQAMLTKYRLDNGQITFEEAIFENSDENYYNGDLGYFTAFDMVYNFETAAYTTEVGRVSSLIRTKYGYHLVKVHDKRPAVGEVKVSHIMFKIPKGSTSQEINTVKLKIDEVYEKLNNGESFADLANRYSEDRSTAVNGGSLDWFGLNKMAKTFEEASFSIQNIGDYTEPFLTEFGWHIVILNNKKLVGSLDDERSKIKKIIEKGTRSNRSDLALLRKIKKEYNFTNHQYNKYRKGKVKDAINSDKLLSATLSNDDIKRYSNDSRELFFLDGIAFTQSNLKDFILEYQEEGNDFHVIYEKFVDFTCLEYEESKLEQKYPEYRKLLNEFRDGILLFDLTSEKVWKKAMEDTIGLQSFFNLNSDVYWWEERAEANIYTCTNPNIVLKLRMMIWQKNQGIITIEQLQNKINKDSPLDLQISSGKFEKGENQYIDQVKWKKGISELNIENTKIVVEITNILDPVRKILKENKGKVISDYQNHLEENWIAELRSKSSIDINKELLYSIIK